MSRVLGFKKKVNSRKREYWESNDIRASVNLERVGKNWYLLIQEQHKNIVDEKFEDYKKLKSKAIKWMKSQASDIKKIRKYKEARKW